MRAIEVVVVAPTARAGFEPATGFAAAMQGDEQRRLAHGEHGRELPLGIMLTRLEAELTPSLRIGFDAGVLYRGGFGQRAIATRECERHHEAAAADHASRATLGVGAAGDGSVATGASMGDWVDSFPSNQVKKRRMA